MLENGRDFAAGKRHSVYNIQRLYLDFLEALDMREDTLPGDATRGELVFYQLGKFSQVISDYEQIHFTTEPKAKYDGLRQVAPATRRPATTPTLTPTSATPPPTPSPSRPCTSPRGCSGRPCSSLRCGRTGSRPASWAA